MNQIKADQAIGKTLTRIWKDSTELVLFFGDEWVHYESEGGDWSALSECEIGGLSFADQHQAGIISLEALQEYQAEQSRKVTAAREEYDRKQYERLRARFEDSEE